VFFNLFAAAEPYVTVKIAHGTPCNDLSSGIGEVEGELKVLQCLGTDVSSGVKRQRTCEGLRQSLQKLTIKQQAKDLFNLTVLDNII